MTTIAQIITDAYQANNLIALSAIPTAAEQATALRVVNRIFSSLFGNELGDKLADAMLDSTGITYPDYSYSYPINKQNIRANTRVINVSTISSTINMPENPQPGCRVSFVDISNQIATNPITVDGNNRLIGAASTFSLSTNLQTIDWFYRDDLVSWQKVTSLALTDDFPLPGEFEEVFIALLSIRLDPMVQYSMPQETSFLMKQMVRKLRARYRQTMEQPSELGLLRTPLFRRPIWRTTYA
jgi:hypothetical protein